MWRMLPIGILTLGLVHQADAQQAAASRLALRVGAGLSDAEYHCAGCEVDPGVPTRVASLQVGLAVTLLR